MGAVAKISIWGRTDFGGNRKAWGDHEFTKSGITNMRVRNDTLFLNSGASAKLNTGFTSTILVFIQNVSSTSTAGVVRVLFDGASMLRIPPGEAVQFSPRDTALSVTMFHSGSLSCGTTIDYSIIGT